MKRAKLNMALVLTLLLSGVALPMHLHFFHGHGMQVDGSCAEQGTVIAESCPEEPSETWYSEHCAFCARNTGQDFPLVFEAPACLSTVGKLWIPAAPGLIPDAAITSRAPARGPPVCKHH
ncbi:MAG: hypothetical protein HYV27_03795 [Candidatus Hydrogenedentes bacterium]|nr:hypothetical protein [Candidatus Hydrogenedentota bacterium]